MVHCNPIPASNQISDGHLAVDNHLTVDGEMSARFLNGNHDGEMAAQICIVTLPISPAGLQVFVNDGDVLNGHGGTYAIPTNSAPRFSAPSCTNGPVSETQLENGTNFEL
jgi:hypothetical protein